MVRFGEKGRAMLYLFIFGKIYNGIFGSKPVFAKILTEQILGFQ